MNWVKSTKCESSACVEVCIGPDGAVAVRNGLVPGEIVWFTHQEWEAFLGGAKEGEFDL